MKLWLGLACALLFLVGIGGVLLHTDQAPLSPPPKAVVADPPAAAVVEAPVHTPSAMTTERFRTEGAELMKKLPRKDKAASPEGSGGIPLLEAAALFEPLVQETRKDPTLEGELVAVYESCATNAAAPDTVRAYCFLQYRQVGRRAGKETKERVVPPYLRNLARTLQN